MRMNRYHSQRLIWDLGDGLTFWYSRHHDPKCLFFRSILSAVEVVHLNMNVSFTQTILPSLIGLKKDSLIFMSQNFTERYTIVALVEGVVKILPFLHSCLVPLCISFYRVIHSKCNF